MPEDGVFWLRMSLPQYLAANNVASCPARRWAGELVASKNWGSCSRGKPPVLTGSMKFSENPFLARGGGQVTRSRRETKSKIKRKNANQALLLVGEVRDRSERVGVPTDSMALNPNQLKDWLAK